MNLHHNVQTNGTKNSSLLIKLGLALFLSLVLLTTSMSFEQSSSRAATVHINAQEELVTAAKVNELKSLDISMRANEHKPALMPVAFKARKPLATTTSVAATSAMTTPAVSNVASIIHQVFGSYSNQAMHIAMCESSMNPGATNSYTIGNSHAAGLFQILYPSTWYGTSQAKASPYDATANTKAAHDIFVRDGYSWREWQCQP